MANRYAIWNRQDDIYTIGMGKNIKGLTYSTPFGTAHFTAEEWLMLHPAPPNAVIICAAGDYNGGFFGTLNNMVQLYTSYGADFSDAKTDQEKLDVIEAFEDAINHPKGEERKQNVADNDVTHHESGAEISSLMQLPVVNDDDPDDEEEELKK